MIKVCHSPRYLANFLTMHKVEDILDILYLLLYIKSAII
jgi:hypothetical protein